MHIKTEMNHAMSASKACNHTKVQPQHSKSEKGELDQHDKAFTNVGRQDTIHAHDVCFGDLIVNALHMAQSVCDVNQWIIPWAVFRILVDP